ncbi:hypothetical protein GO730_19275 [Spirosoma sp. HMF3257]|uniref:VWA domain-containing protein n=1 Tax=Spirosoma telluris TaxID=2183553 RepID=A0A327NK40_9BACT|nr:hypothetical protein [Spirosoma telluris]RAI75750.1 hypothetical protein HMF3257_19205 [Spirosoma telluris]
MSEQTDKPLHDWVRQSLDTYRPNYDPTDWVLLQRTLRRRRWIRRGAWGSAGLLLFGFLSWLIIDRQNENTASNIDSVSRRKSIRSADSTRADNSPKTTSLSVNQKVQQSAIIRSPSTPIYSAQAVEFVAVRLPAPLNPVRQVNPLKNNLTEQIHRPQLIAFSPEETVIKHQMITGDFGPDSTSYQTLARNLRSWPDAVIVCDLTTSMYPYTTQLFAWFRKNAPNSTIRGMVFFTDCDSLGQQTRAGGPAGRMFITRERNPANALPILLDAARNTVHNDDDAENDIEALLAAQQAFPEAKHLILLADNISTVKDMALLTKIRKPVHVVLCGTTGSDTTLAFQPDYYTIANHTQGSLHTLEDDFTPSSLSRTTTLRVGSIYYRYIPRKKQFKPTPFDHRPRHFLNLIWF